MNTQNWIEQVLPLDRPEYAKQPEALLTDLIWRSQGSSLSIEFDTLRKRGLLRLVPKRLDRSKSKEIVETFPAIEQIKLEDLIGNQEEYASAVMPLLFSLQAPQARGDKSIAVVPIHPDVAVFQTLHGLVNKESPADLAKIIEAVGWLGGSEGYGSVAAVFLEALSNKNNEGIDQGLTGFLNGMISSIAQRAWQELPGTENESSSTWRPVLPQPIDDSRGKSLMGHRYHNTPFYWFWEKWSTLCNPSNQWVETLPTRRFVDWATCILRTGLSFAYLWEANFFIFLQDVIRKELEQRKTNSMVTTSTDALNSMLLNGAVLASIEPLNTPTSQKDIWPALKILLARGYEIRNSIIKLLTDSQVDDNDLLVIIDKWLDSVTISDLEELSRPTRIESKTAENAREFVRYLLRPRSSDDDTADQADFYFLARTNKKADNFWLQPGPEWFVVITSLLSTTPGGTCSLGTLLNDLQRLGIRVDRSVLIEILEDAGLTTDSPDADDALIIASGF